VSGGFGAGRGGRFGRPRGAGVTLGGGGADIVPRRRGPVLWERPEPALFGLDGRRDLLLKLDATLVNAGDRALAILDARLGDQSPAWDAPRAEWYENGDVRRAVFRVEPWLPCTLEPGATRLGARLVWVVPRSDAPARGLARLVLTLDVESLGDVRFEVHAAVPEGFERRR
jgi:hypothetical protein